MVSQDPFDVATPLNTSCSSGGRNNLEMSLTNQQQYNHTCGQVPSSDIKYDQDLQQHDLLCPTNVFYTETEPGSDSSSPLIPASMEQQGSRNVPLFMLRSKPPTT
eukprot:scaffold372611_cov51-Attheya_sp.AAC.1